MKKLVLFCLSLGSFFIGFSQTKQPKTPDSLRPTEKIQVNKVYDDQGRLTRYDSIYSYSYSSSGNMNDSLKAVFDSYIKNNKVFQDALFDEFFKEDSLTRSFNPADFFSQGLKKDQKDIKNIMMQVDSLRHMFYEKQGNMPTKDTLKTSK